MKMSQLSWYWLMEAFFAISHYVLAAKIDMWNLEV
jgi:hypothetical protein